ncbi:alpha/beta hydrolase [Mycolicibacterium frederiksbergense]|uniref:alpha/beta hydrolase n=1 Tax=Mycolicibacterium frederiksbergense TaxID=117567 RepID=UPI003999BFB1
MTERGAAPLSMSIPRGPFDLAGHLYLPDGFDETRSHAAIVLSTPGSSVKEQIGANYASRLAGRGLVALAFDPAHQGGSGGEPRDVEDPYRRGEDISYAIDALSVVPGVDPGRIGSSASAPEAATPCTPHAPTIASARWGRSLPATWASRGAQLNSHPADRLPRSMTSRRRGPGKCRTAI